MSAPYAGMTQLINGNFADAEGNPVALGYIIMQLNQDAQSSLTSQVVGGRTIKITLDSSGNAVAGQYVWPNNALNPTTTFYIVNVYTAAGQLVWGPNYMLVNTTPTFDLDGWVPNQVGSGGAPVGSITLQTNEVNNGSQQLLDLHAGSNITLTDNGSGRVTIAGAGGSITLQVEGVNNAVQSLLNLESTDGSVTITDEGNGSVNFQASGGGPEATSPFFTPPTSLSSQGDVVGQGGNDVISLLFMNLPYEITFSNISWFSQTGDNGTDLSDIGIYSVASVSAVTGNLVAHIGPTTGVGSDSTNVVAIVEGTITLPAGLYLFGTLSNNGAGFSIDYAVPNQLGYAWSTVSTGSGGTLPASITIVPKGIVWMPSHSGITNFLSAFPAIGLS